MTFTTAKEKEYIPTWKENDKSENPIVLTLKYLTITERDDLMIRAFDTESKPTVRVDFNKAFKRGVKSIKNLIVDGRDITTPEQFLKLSGFDLLYTEVALEIISMNAVEDSKNSQ